MPFYHRHGLDLFFERTGAGAPLILLHGFGQHGGSWASIASILGRFFDVIIPDQRGCGRSQIAAPGHGIADLAGDTIALLDHLGLERAHVAGWSMGGMIATELALSHPERLTTLALHSMVAGGVNPYQVNWTRMRQRIMASGDKDLAFETRIIGFFTPQFINERQDRIEAFRQIEFSDPHPPTAAGLAGQVSAMTGFDVRARLPDIRTPTLVTVGSEDRTTLPAQSRVITDAIPSSEFFLFAGAGHLPQFQYPDEFTSLSMGFMLKHEPKGAPEAG